MVVSETSRTSRHITALLVALLALSATRFLQTAVPRTGMLASHLDDAWMFLRYARHFLDGYGYAWNEGDPPVNGCTSPLYLWLLTALRALLPTPDDLLLSWTSLVLGALGAAALSATAWAAMAGTGRWRLIATLLAPTLLLQDRVFVYHCTTGMDTTLGLLCDALLALAAVSGPPTTRRVLLTVLAGWAAVAARPESALYAVLLPPLLWHAEHPDARQAPTRYVGLLALAGLLHVLLLTALFGEPIPLAFFDKAVGALHGYTDAWKWNAVDATVELLQSGAPWVAALLLLGDRRSWPAIRAPLLPLTLHLLWLFSVVQIMGMHARYYVPMLPILALAGLRALRGGLARGEIPVSRVLGILGFLAVTGPTLLNAQLSAAWDGLDLTGAPIAARTRWESASPLPLPELGWWPATEAMLEVVQAAPPGTVLAATEHGLIGARRPDLRLVDLTGLHDPATAFGAFDADAVLADQPDLVWLPHPAYTALTAAMLDHPALARDYDVFLGVFDYGVALRRDSPRRGALLEALEAAFAHHYPGRSLTSTLARPAR